MTGPAERPTRKPLETRIAAHKPADQLPPLQAGERRLLSAFQAAGYATLRQSTQGAASRAVARARAEIATEFAHRWADLRRAPAALRAAMAAALEAEQAATLSARTRTILEQLYSHQRNQRSQLRAAYGAQRKALTTWHRESRGTARTRSHAKRPTSKHPNPSAPSL